MQILLCCGKHKLDPVQLIYFAGTWIVVDGINALRLGRQRIVF